MPRTNSGSELYQYLNRFEKFIIFPATTADTVTTAAIEAGDTTVDLTAVTGFADGDYVMIDGDGGVEITRISGAPATSANPLNRPDRKSVV